MKEKRKKKKTNWPKISQSVYSEKDLQMMMRDEAEYEAAAYRCEND